MLAKKKMGGKIYDWEKAGKFIFGRTKSSGYIRTSTIVSFFYNKRTDIGVVETLNSIYLLLRHNRDSKKVKERD
jgi:hypothetical protein